jgi:hypothetical protein
MDWPMYVPSSSTLVILFKIARARLMASSHNARMLTDDRLISATEEMNRISDDIREAENQAAMRRAEEAQPGRIRWSSAAELPVPDLTMLAKVAAWADLRHAVNTGTEAPYPRSRSPGP